MICHDVSLPKCFYIFNEIIRSTVYSGDNSDMYQHLFVSSSLPKDTHELCHIHPSIPGATSGCHMWRGGPEPGTKIAQGDILCRAGIAGLICLSLIFLNYWLLMRALSACFAWMERWRFCLLAEDVRTALHLYGHGRFGCNCSEVGEKSKLLCSFYVIDPSCMFGTRLTYACIIFQSTRDFSAQTADCVLSLESNSSF